MFSSKWKLPVIMGSFLIIFALFITGCGKKDITSQTPASSVPNNGVEKNIDNSKDLSSVEGVETDSRAEKEVAEAAISYALDSNAGSEFEVTSIIVAGEWARVGIQEIGVPVEEAIAFGIFLRKESDGWIVTKTGTSISADDLPDAPPQLFE